MVVGRRLLALLLGWVLIVALWSDPPTAFAAPPTGTKAPVANAGKRNSLGELTAPDEVSARQIAKMLGERVEVIGGRTEFSSTWALPNGTMSSGVGAGPVWIRNGGDGTELEDWTEVDVDLVVDPDGTVRPKGHPAKIRLSGGSDQPVAAMASVADRSDPSTAITFGWGKALPTPTLDGARATYSEALPGVDLILEVTRTGVEQYLVVKNKAAAESISGLTMPVETTGRYALKEGGGGALSIVEGATEVARMATPEAWDARLDAVRAHPVTQKWDWGPAKGSGLARSLGQQPAWKQEKAKQSKPSVAPEKEQLRRGGPAQLPNVPASKSASVRAGRGVTAGGDDPRTVPNLALANTAKRISASKASVAMELPKEFIADPATSFPVVVDPTVDYMWGFDTWVSKDWANTDKSSDTMLRIGGATGTARSFIHFNVGQTVGTRIIEAELNLWETHAWSCQSRNWELWDTGQASPATRWGAQPIWYSRYSTSSETTGYSTACGDGWVGIDARNLVQAWADNGWTGTVAVGLKAENEADNYALKEFNSANAGSNVPALWINYNTPPTAPTDLTVIPSNLVDGINYTNQRTPMLRSTGHDADGDDLYMVYRLHNGENGPIMWEADRWVPQGVPADISVATNAGAFNDGATYSFIAHAMDTQSVWNTAPSQWRKVVADFTAPPAPLAVTSALYKSDGTWNGDAGTAGTFKVTFGAGEANPHGFLWGVDGPPSDQNHPLGNELTYTPATAGRHVLNVQAIDKAGNTSPVVSYAFNVGQGAITSPSDGSRIVRRTRLEIDAMPTLTDVRFQWRRGPESAITADVPSSLLMTAGGAPFAATWQNRAQMGSYATLDAAQLVGYIGGPFQVRPVFKGADGVEKFGAWVSLFVDPDADGAASDQIGPGGVNLLTGDYSLGATDADEFGLEVGRTSSSRDMKLGYVPQYERLNASQSGFNAAPDGFSGSALCARVTDRGHTNGDALRVDSLPGNSDAFVGVGGDAGALRLNMKAGRTYRVSGWVYVPAATGLNPEHPRGLTLAGFYRKDGVYSDPVALGSMSSRPKVVDAWQYLTFDFPVAAGASEAFIRLYNGNSGAGKPVYFDDLSVREIWAPVGPQWSLGTADAAAGTDYLRLEKSVSLRVF